MISQLKICGGLSDHSQRTCQPKCIECISPAGDAAPVCAAEVGGVAGARHGEVGALALRLVGAVLAVGVAVATPVLRDAPPARGALKSYKGGIDRHARSRDIEKDQLKSMLHVA